MRFIGDDQVEEAHVEIFVGLHHRRVRRQVDALIAIVCCGGVDDHARLARHELFEDAVGLATQLLAVAEEEDALHPARAHQHVAQRDGDARLARAGGLHHEGFAKVVLEALGDALDRFELVHAVGDGEVRLDVGKRLLSSALVDQVLEAVLRVEAIDLAVRVALRVVPQEDVDAIGEEHDGAHAGRLLERVGVLARLLASCARVLRGLLRLDDPERLAVVAVEHVVGEAIAARRGEARELQLLLHLLGILAIDADVPSGGEQGLVDEAAARGRFVELEGRGDLLARIPQLGQLARVLLGGARGFRRGAFGLEPLLGLFVELLEHRLVLRLSEAQLLEGVLRLRGARRLGRWRRVLRRGLELAAIELHEEPARDVEELSETFQRELAGDGAPGVRGVVARLAHGMELVLDDLGNRLPEGGLVHQIVQVVGVRRPEAITLVDGADSLFDETTLLDERARGVFVGVALGEAREIGQHGAARAEELEVHGLHERNLLSSRGVAEHAGPLFNERAITPAPRRSSASSSTSGSSAGPRAPSPWSCCPALRPSRARGSGARLLSTSLAG